MKITIHNSMIIIKLALNNRDMMSLIAQQKYVILFNKNHLNIRRINL
jgi:hypothetical protein